MISVTYDSRKRRLIHSDRKQDSGCLECGRYRKGQEGAITKGHRETFGGDGCVYHLDCSDGFIGICTYKASNCRLLMTVYCMPVKPFYFLKYVVYEKLCQQRDTAN